MSSISLTLVFGLALSFIAQAKEIECPSFQGKSTLTSVVLFDGPPEQKADLMPDVSKGRAGYSYASWDVSYIFQSGRNLFLVCRFSDDKELRIEVEKKVQRCVFRTRGKAKPAELICK